ncbi:MAG: peptidase M64 [Bacteroidaceae bacterium]|nr:peptidase M64 [Bacteroidaceae bacterium]
MKQIITIIMLALATMAGAQTFDEYFEDNTLRLDYVLGGDSAAQYIQLSQLYKQKQWAGRRNRLAETYLLGNAQINVFDSATGKLIYVHTFSTLFQEWLNETEATQMKRAFEASYNIPFPKRPIDIRVTLTDNHNKICAMLTHHVDPTDILIRPIGDNGIPYKYIQKNGDVSECVDIAIVAEGYTATEMDKFYRDSQRAADAIFSHEPFKSMKHRFNVVAVGAVSNESGPSEPGRGIWHDTVLRSHYDTFYSDRYLTTSAVHKLFDLLSGVPFEHIIVLINTPRYGGGGIYNQWMCSSSDHATFKQVLVHEFGHSYAGLADEYNYGDNHVEWYPADTEPWEPNITTLKDFDKKWKDLIPAGTPVPTPPTINNYQQTRTTMSSEELNKKTQRVGVFEGAGYMARGAYRPAELCRMNVNEVEDFCPVCTRAIIGITDFYTGTVKK